MCRTGFRLILALTLVMHLGVPIARAGGLDPRPQGSTLCLLDEAIESNFQSRFEGLIARLVSALLAEVKEHRETNPRSRK